MESLVECVSWLSSEEDCCNSYLECSDCTNNNCTWLSYSSNCTAWSDSPLQVTNSSYCNLTLTTGKSIQILFYCCINSKNQL